MNTIGSLIVRRNVFSELKPWKLQIRYHESVGETEYVDVCILTPGMAEMIVDTGGASWLFREPCISCKRRERSPYNTEDDPFLCKICQENKQMAKLICYGE